jgi:hypothetical protein
MNSVLRVTLVAALLIVLSRIACAALQAQLGDLGLRHDIEVLADYD